jgi:hypothetical protein
MIDSKFLIVDDAIPIEKQEKIKETSYYSLSIKKDNPKYPRNTLINHKQSIITILKFKELVRKYGKLSDYIEKAKQAGFKYIKLHSQSASGVAFKFDVNLLGTGQFTCLDLGVCTANNDGNSSLYINYRSTNRGHWTTDLAIAFYGTGQTFGGCQCVGTNCHCGDTLIGAFPSQYNEFVTGNVQVNSSFSPALASGFTAICVVNTCSGGYCETNDYNRFYGSFSISHVNCTAAPVIMGYPSNQPTSQPSTLSSLLLFTAPSP